MSLLSTDEAMEENKRNKFVPMRALNSSFCDYLPNPDHSENWIKGPFLLNVEDIIGATLAQEKSTT